jgi:Asp/Glu/hydantoin racemase
MISRVALVHATPLAMEPVSMAFSHLWPSASCMNILDDCLSKDLANNGGLNEQMIRRIIEISRYAKESGGAKAILFTCSAFSKAIDEAARIVGIPTLKPNQAMFDEALEISAGIKGRARIALLTTFSPATESMNEEWLEYIEGKNLEVELVSKYVQGSREALMNGGAKMHDQLLLEAAQKLTDCDIIMLGQFSMARSKGLLAANLDKPVLASPDSAVALLKKLLDNAG